MRLNQASKIIRSGSQVSRVIRANSTVWQQTINIPQTGVSKSDWDALFFDLQQGIQAFASTNKAKISIPGRDSNTPDVDGMEGFARAFAMSSYWMTGANSDVFTHAGSTTNAGAFFREGLLAGTDSTNIDYWGALSSTSQNQRLVEFGSLAIGLWFSKTWVWDVFTTEQKTQVANYLRQANSAIYNFNNWRMFPMLVNLVLKKLGESYNDTVLQENLNWSANYNYVGNGWYKDGLAVFSIDPYSIYAFHYYLLLWVYLDGDSNPALATKIKDRFRVFSAQFPYFVGREGNIPAWGRSLVYRCGYLAPFALGVLLNCVDISQSQIKAILNRSYRYFFGADRGLTIGSVKTSNSNRYLSLGYLYETTALPENYSGSCSPLWMAKAFTLFLLPNNFWLQDESELPIDTSNYSVSIPEAGLNVIGNNGTVYLQNLKSLNISTTTEDRLIKYSGVLYSTKYGLNAGLSSNVAGSENKLLFKINSSTHKSRLTAFTEYQGKGFIAASYKIPSATDPQSRVRHFVIHKNDAYISVIWVSANEILTIREGGFSIPLSSGTGFSRDTPSSTHDYVSTANQGSLIKNLLGWNAFSSSLTTFSASAANGNPYHLFSVTPRLEFQVATAPGVQTIYRLATLVNAKSGAVSKAELEALIQSFEVIGDQVKITFSDGEVVLLQMGETVDTINQMINGQAISGKIAYCRVPATGTPEIILQADRRVAWANFTGGTAGASIESTTSDLGVFEKHVAGGTGTLNLNGTGQARRPVVSSGSVQGVYLFGPSNPRRIRSHIRIRSLVNMGLGVFCNLSADAVSGYLLDITQASSDPRPSVPFIRFAKVVNNIVDTNPYFKVYLDGSIIGDTLNLTLVKEQGLIKAFVNQCLWHELNDPSPLSGDRMGFRIFSSSTASNQNTTGFQFDEVEVFA